MDDLQVLKPAPVGSQSAILDKIMCVSVKLSRIGTSKKVDTSAVEADVDKTMLRVSKKILEADELTAVSKHDNKIRKMLRTYIIPKVKFLRGGIYPIPIELVGKVDTELVSLFRERAVLCQKLFDRYTALCEEAKDPLRGLYDPLDYPPLSAVQKAYRADACYVNLGVPKALEKIDASIFQREQEQQKVRLAEAVQEVEAGMVEVMQGLVGHLLDRLTEDDDGKPKKFQKSLVDNFNQFLETFNAKNITENTQLSDLADELRQILKGVEPGTLRNNKDVRSVVREGMVRMQDKIQGLGIVSEAGGRMYDRDDDDDEEAAA